MAVGACVRRAACVRHGALTLRTDPVLQKSTGVCCPRHRPHFRNRTRLRRVFQMGHCSSSSPCQALMESCLSSIEKTDVRTILSSHPACRNSHCVHVPSTSGAAPISGIRVHVHRGSMTGRVLKVLDPLDFGSASKTSRLKVGRQAVSATPFPALRWEVVLSLPGSLKPSHRRLAAALCQGPLLRRSHEPRPWTSEPGWGQMT